MKKRTRPKSDARVQSSDDDSPSSHRHKKPKASHAATTNDTALPPTSAPSTVNSPSIVPDPWVKGGADLYTAASLSGYLDIDPTRLGEELNVRWFKDIITAFSLARKASFGLGRDVTKSLSNKKMIACLAHSTVKKNLLTPMIEDDNIDCTIKGPKDKTEIKHRDITWVYYYHLVILYRILENCSLLDNTLTGDHEVQYFGHQIEDWYRALAMLRFGCKHNVATFNFKGAPKAVEYIIPSTSQAGLEPTGSIPLDELPTVWLDSGLKVEGKLLQFPPGDYDTIADIRAFFKVDATGAPLDTDGGEAPAASVDEFEEEVVKLMAKYVRESRGQPDPRPAVSRATQITFLDTRGKDVKVMYEDFREDQRLTARQMDVELDDDEDDEDDGPTRPPLEQAGLDSATKPIMRTATKEETREFYKLRRNMSSTSAEYPEYADACQLLGYTVEQVMSNDIAIRNPRTGETLDCRPNPLQVITVAWMLQQKMSPIHGGCLALSCGAGKTITVLWSIALRFEQALSQHQEGQKSPMNTPCVILVPNGDIIDVFYREWKRFFSKALTMYICHSDPKNLKIEDFDKKAHYLPASAEEALEQITTSYPTDDPNSAGVFVVSTYSTWHTRFLRTVPKVEEVRNLMKMADIDSLDDVDLIDTAPDKLAAQPDLVDIKRQLQEWKDEHGDNLQTTDTETSNSTEAAMIRLEHTYTNVARGIFGDLYLDEGQYIKHPTSKAHIAAYTLYAQNVWVVSATPANNSVADYAGLLHLLWEESWTTGPISQRRRKLHFYEDDYAQEYFEKNPEYAERFGRRPLWKLNLHLFLWLVNNQKMEGQTARLVLSAVQELTVLRLTAATQIRMPDGTLYILGDNIPTYKICTVELALPSHHQPAMDRVTTACLPILSRATGATGGENQKNPVADTKGLRNHRVHRHLCLVATDLRLQVLVTRIGWQQTNAQAVSTWHNVHHDHGFSFYQRWTGADNEDPLYSDRWTAASWVTQRSAKLRYICRLLQKHVFLNGEKLVIWYHWPIEGWLMSMFLHTIGIAHHFIGAQVLANDRQTILGQWQDPQDISKMVLVASVPCAGEGINLQTASHVAVLLSMPPNVNKLIQVLGRQHRYGQTHEQTFYILTLAESYDQILQGKACKKYYTQLLGESNLDDLNIEEDRREELRQDIIAEGSVGDNVSLEKTIHLMKDSDLRSQVDDMMIQLMGMRCSRLGWDNDDLRGTYERSFKPQGDQSDEGHAEEADVPPSDGEQATFTDKKLQKLVARQDLKSLRTPSKQKSQKPKSGDSPIAFHLRPTPGTPRQALGSSSSISSSLTEVSETMDDEDTVNQTDGEETSPTVAKSTSKAKSGASKNKPKSGASKNKSRSRVEKAKSKSTVEKTNKNGKSDGHRVKDIPPPPKPTAGNPAAAARSTRSTRSSGLSDNNHL